MEKGPDRYCLSPDGGTPPTGQLAGDSLVTVSISDFFPTFPGKFPPQGVAAEGHVKSKISMCLPNKSPLGKLSGVPV